MSHSDYKEVRVRIAPSPTGDPHVGTAYQALFDYVWAKRNNGKFILRIEDTDQARSTKHSEQTILDSLKWLGLQWDEGPDIGGPYGPYRQSERLETYREHVNILLKKGHAYRCFCTKERLDEMRAAQMAQGSKKPGYDRHCRNITEEESSRRALENESFVVRMKVPVDGICTMNDLLRGEIQREWSLIDDQVILKSDGFPTYHLAVVVDDYLMKISHIIRGEEWINSVPKHLLLYKYFGWQPPVFCHLPLLRNNDKNRSKLSKRKNPTSINYYRKAGFLPEAILNFLGMMGWCIPVEQGEPAIEKFSLDEMIEHFDLKDVTLGGPVFDVEKLKWLNARYIREDLDTDQLLQRIRNWALNDDNLKQIIPLVHGRLETLSDWGYKTALFFTDSVPVKLDDLVLKNRSSDELIRLLQLVTWELEKLSPFTRENIGALFTRLSGNLDLKLKDLTLPFYVAISGLKVSTPLFDSMEILGSDMVRMRLRRAIEILGGISSKKLKALQKEYENNQLP